MQQYFDYYNNHRPHRSLGYRMPSEVYFEGRDSLCPAYTKQKLVLTMGNGNFVWHCYGAFNVSIWDAGI